MLFDQMGRLAGSIGHVGQMGAFHMIKSISPLSCDQFICLYSLTNIIIIDNIFKTLIANYISKVIMW